MFDSVLTRIYGLLDPNMRSYRAALTLTLKRHLRPGGHPDHPALFAAQTHHGHDDSAPRPPATDESAARHQPGPDGLLFYPRATLRFSFRANDLILSDGSSDVILQLPSPPQGLLPERAYDLRMETIHARLRSIHNYRPLPVFRLIWWSSLAVFMVTFVAYIIAGAIDTAGRARGAQVGSAISTPPAVSTPATTYSNPGSTLTSPPPPSSTPSGQLPPDALEALKRP